MVFTISASTLSANGIPWRYFAEPEADLNNEFKSR
jgi:hypothetical protein